MRNYNTIVHLLFWKEHPALLMGLSAVCGASSYLLWDAPWNFLWITCWSLYLIILRKIHGIGIIALFWLYSFGLFHPFFDPSFPKEGMGLFSPKELHLRSNPFGQGWLYTGTFTMDTFPQLHSFPISFYWSSNHPDRPPANQSFWIAGQLESDRSPYRLFLIIDPKKKWEPAAHTTYSFAELRCQWKEKFGDFLSSHLQQKETASFLMALFSGEVEEPWLRTLLNKIGVQHLLAVSGFHFALLAACGFWILRCLLSHSATLWVLLLFLTGYFFFVGCSPSVFRAWFTFSLWTIGSLYQRTTSALNLLGVTLIVELLYNPLSLDNLGFQLSFCSVGAILLLYPLLQSYRPIVSPLRNRLELRSFPLLSCCGLLLTKALLNTVNLTIAVHGVLVPLLLYHFHLFPWLGLFYNLFFPCLASLSLLGVTTALCIAPISERLCQWLFVGVEWFTQQLLHLAFYPPAFCDVVLLAPSFPAWVIPPYLFFLFSLSITLRNREIKC